MNATDYRWSLGTLVGLPLAILGCLVLAAVAVLCWIWYRHERGDEGAYSEPGIALTSFIGAVLCTLIAVAGTVWGMWPFKAEYHQWQQTAGTVAEIDSRLLADGNGGATERFVVTFDDGRQRACDDTRCSQVHEGDYLTLDCKRAWQWAGSHGYDCNYVSHEATR